MGRAGFGDIMNKFHLLYQKNSFDFYMTGHHIFKPLFASIKCPQGGRTILPPSTAHNLWVKGPLRHGSMS